MHILAQTSHVVDMTAVRVTVTIATETLAIRPVVPGDMIVASSPAQLCVVQDLSKPGGLGPPAFCPEGCTLDPTHQHLSTVVLNGHLSPVPAYTYIPDPSHLKACKNT